MSRLRQRRAFRVSIHRRVSAAAATRRRPSKFTPGPPLLHALPCSLPISLPPPLRLCRLSGFSAPLTTLSRKYVNVHACPIIRSSRSLFSLVPSFLRSRSSDRFFSPIHPRASGAEIDRSSRESHEFTSCREASSPVPRERENDRQYNASPPWSLEEKGEEREREERQ